MRGEEVGQRPLRELSRGSLYTVQPPAARHAASSVPLALDVAVARLLHSAGVSADVVGRPRAVVGRFELALVLARPLAQATHEDAPVPRPDLINLAALEYCLHDAAAGCSSSRWRTISSPLSTVLQEQRRHAEHGQPQQGAPSEEGSSLSHELPSQPGGQRKQRGRHRWWHEEEPTQRRAHGWWGEALQRTSKNSRQTKRVASSRELTRFAGDNL